MEAMASRTKLIHFPITVNKSTEVEPKARPNSVMSFQY